ncbi:phosphoinositide 3-kinase regulatory subunit 5-like [Periophthalmus magnuspinnatus]|uniref:phosphoinositide 3-kinase regulatory subunit 5-like n=1 Tax=Periophthalmus magnuspinnatus TaxID=409849 RepID=UPI00145AA6D3|nr:phosphoinositide 3-kinase regulatory subunit 5-like [Periophthalmus magnuspinnatus]
MEQAEQSSCTEDRIEHVLERCLCDLGLDTPNKQLWNAGLCINRWCLEELVKRNSQNSVILLNKILKKTKAVLERCEYELVVPLTLLFTSTLLKAPHVPADCGLLQEAYSLFHCFLSWPEPCSSACRRVLLTLQRELRAPGISFQRLVRTEHGVPSNSQSSKTMTVLLVSPEEDIPPEVQCASVQLSTSQSYSRDISISLILQALQAARGDVDLPVVHSALQTKSSEELDQLLETLTVNMEQSASTDELSKARQSLHHSINTLLEKLAGTLQTSFNIGTTEGLILPLPKCHIRTWESDNFDFLHSIIISDVADPDSLDECFLNGDLDDAIVDEEDETEANQQNDFSNNRISTVSSTSGDSVLSGRSLSSSWSVSTMSCSSGMDSDFNEEQGHDEPQKQRQKPKKKSKSFLGVERFSLLFKTPCSPLHCRRARSMGCRTDLPRNKTQSNPSLRQSPTSAGSPQKHLCMRRRPILSCDLTEEPEQVVQVRVVVFGGDKELGRLARAYTDLQHTDSKQLTKRCKLRFYFVPTRRKNVETQAFAETANEGSTSVDLIPESSSTVAQMLGMVDPWYERNVLSLLSLSSDVLCQSANKDSDDSGCCVPTMRPSLLAEMVLYYCRHADETILVQLYQAELTLSGGEKRVEVFVHSLELGHSAGTRAVKAMGAVSKRLGIDDEQGAAPLTLNMAYNKIAISGRSQWIEVDKVCTSVNVYKACRKHEQLESLQLMMAEVLKKQCSKSKRSFKQFCISEVKVDCVQVHAGSEGTTFAVCLDQDEKKFFQSIVRCEVSLCSKPGSSSDWKTYRICPGQVQPLHPSYRSLLCLPLCSFCPSQH